MEGGAELWRCYVSRMLSGDEVTVQSLSPSKNSHRKWQDGSCLGTEHFNSSEWGEALKQCFRNCRLQHRGAKVQGGGGGGGASTWEPEKVKMIWCHFIPWDWGMDTFERHSKGAVTLSRWRNSYRIRYIREGVILSRVFTFLMPPSHLLWKNLKMKKTMEKVQWKSSNFSTRTVVKWPT